MHHDDRYPAPARRDENPTCQAAYPYESSPAPASPSSRRTPWQQAARPTGTAQKHEGNALQQVREVRHCTPRNIRFRRRRRHARYRRGLQRAPQKSAHK